MSEQAKKKPKPTVDDLVEALADAVDLIENLIHFQGARLYPAGQQRMDDYREVLSRATQS